MGRPSTFTQEMADKICEHIAGGGAIRKFCNEDGNPSWPTVSRWLNDYPSFHSQYARAREQQADAYFERVLDVASDQNRDPNDRRIEVDALKWTAGKLRPKIYGEKQTVEHTGEDGGPIQTVDLSGLSLDEKKALRDLVRKTNASSD